MEIKEAINILESKVKDPYRGLPEDAFLFISRLTPLVNVDLLIKDDKNRTLMTWREDRYSKPGWHIPGGIIRYKETIAERIQAVAKTEFGAEIEFQTPPLAINEIIIPERRERGHFISLLFNCKLISKLDPALQYISGKPKNGQWKWHVRCPRNMLDIHRIYDKYLRNDKKLKFSHDAKEKYDER